MLNCLHVSDWAAIFWVWFDVGQWQYPLRSACHIQLRMTGWCSELLPTWEIWLFWTLLEPLSYHNKSKSLASLVGRWNSMTSNKWKCSFSLSAWLGTLFWIWKNMYSWEERGSSRRSREDEHERSIHGREESNDLRLHSLLAKLKN